MAALALYPKNKADVLRKLSVWSGLVDLTIHTPVGGTILIHADCDKDMLKKVIANVRYRTWAADWRGV